ncbi:MAG: hypothetical protein GY866_23340 [Proteobacteria bacterium]|nr:hypothetical protein [Pseudomonadota bacterium]
MAGSLHHLRTQAFPFKSPTGQPQHVALWKMQDMEVFEMVMFFFAVSDLRKAVDTIGSENCSGELELSPGRKAAALKKRELGLSVLIFLAELPPA